MPDKVVVIFVEGDTEIAFYNNLVSLLREKAGGKLSCKVTTKNLRGIGNYENDIIRKMSKEIMPKSPQAQFYVMICYDTDVFKYAKKPPMDKKVIKDKLRALGIRNVYCIEAKESIEDWFLLDKEGLLSSIGLAKSTRINGTGINELERIFKLKNKTYTKGSKNYGFVNSLDIEKIAGQICSEICPLCHALGVKCHSKQSCKK
ncbi:MAG: hypothetical protein RR394_07775 [Oscillospiraceae bacterium]